MDYEIYLASVLHGWRQDAPGVRFRTLAQIMPHLQVDFNFRFMSIGDNSHFLEGSSSWIWSDNPDKQGGKHPHQWTDGQRRQDLGVFTMHPAVLSLGRAQT